MFASARTSLRERPTAIMTPPATGSGAKPKMRGTPASPGVSIIPPFGAAAMAWTRGWVGKAAADDLFVVGASRQDCAGARVDDQHGALLGSGQLRAHPLHRLEIEA